MHSTLSFTTVQTILSKRKKGKELEIKRKRDRLVKCAPEIGGGDWERNRRYFWRKSSWLNGGVNYKTETQT